MIIEELVKVKINACNMHYYTNLGYHIPKELKNGIYRFNKTTTFIYVNSLHLTSSSTVMVKRLCFCCEEISKIPKYSYRKLCEDCAKKLCNSETKSECKKHKNSKMNLCSCGKIKYIIANRCVDCYSKRERTRKPPRLCTTCKKVPLGYNKAKKQCLECYNKSRPSGSKHPNFNPLLTDKDRRKPSHSHEYKLWAKLVKKRDDFKCRTCNCIKGNNLCSHHLDGWSTFPEKRYQIDNGITLCENCHHPNIYGSFHNLYGTHNNTENQLIDYISYRKNNKTLLRTNNLINVNSMIDIKDR